jgi:hypothetical protein
VNQIIRIAALATLLSLCACSTTKLADTWRDPAYKAEPVKRILVVGVLLREQVFDPYFENALARALTNDGYLVVTGSMAFDPYDLDREKVVKYVKDHRLDLVIQQKIATKTTTTYTPPSTTFVALPTNAPSGYGGAYGGWYGSPTPAYLASRQGYVSEESSVTTEIKVFSARTEGLVWSGNSATANVLGDKDAARSLAVEVARELTAAGILQK